MIIHDNLGSLGDPKPSLAVYRQQLFGWRIATTREDVLHICGRAGWSFSRIYMHQLLYRRQTEYMRHCLAWVLWAKCRRLSEVW